MKHFKVPTMLVVWPDDSPEHPAYVATPLHNCKPDPLVWLTTLAGECGTPPCAALVVVPVVKAKNRPDEPPLPLEEPIAAAGA